MPKKIDPNSVRQRLYQYAELLDVNNNIKHLEETGKIVFPVNFLERFFPQRGLKAWSVPNPSFLSQFPTAVTTVGALGVER